MTTLVTGVAGFIGYHTATKLLDRGDEVIGIDNLSNYYSLELKMARLSRLKAREGFTFYEFDLADKNSIEELRKSIKSFTSVIHLAAQAGVRHSLKRPFDYGDANLLGHLSVLELCRQQSNFSHLVYASSSSVYGLNKKLPFSVSDPTNSPVSLYAATKLANELMSYSYSHLYKIPQTGLRFFTVYGPWGRPDMAYYIFASSIVNNKPITVHNFGDMRRDFTYVDDVVEGIISAHDHPPEGGNTARHKIYNIGNNKSEPLMRLIRILEEALGRKAQIISAPMQLGEVKETFADIEPIKNDLGFRPHTQINEGIPKFVEWFKSYHKIS